MANLNIRIENKWDLPIKQKMGKGIVGISDNDMQVTDNCLFQKVTLALSS
jgi:hypothetical protein